MRTVLGLMFAVMATLAMSAFSTNVNAATFVVNTTLDTQDAAPGNGVCADTGGMCSLRAAITEANALAGADTITLPAGTYTETLVAANENANAGGDFDITSALTINGAGSGTTIVQANAAPAVATERVFHILTGGTSVTIGGVTVRNGGNPVANALAGGGIRIEGATSNLTLNDSLITDNRSERRGAGLGVATAGAGVTINNCSFTLNISGPAPGTSASGGGMSVDYEGGVATPVSTVNINNTTFDGNKAESPTGSTFGGAIISRALASIINITNCTITNNQANGISSATTGGHAGGIYNQDAQFTVTNSVITGNHATTFGGGGRAVNVNNTTSPSSTDIINTTISGNTAESVGGWMNIGTNAQDLALNIDSSTISGNMATDVAPNGVAGGLYNADTDAGGAVNSRVSPIPL